MPKRQLERLCSIAALTACIGLAGEAVQAQKALANPGAEGEAPGRHLNFRVGAASTDTVGRPTLCLEVSPLAKLSIDLCGTGSGFLHKEEGQEMAHFRAKWIAYQRSLGSGDLRLQPGIGFAELEVAVDDSGFSFSDVSSRGASTAGPEVSASASWLAPIGGRFAFVASATTGFAYFAHAPDLQDPQRAEQFFASFEVGIGF